MKRSFFILISGCWLLSSPFSPAIVDVNNNGLSDFWEKEHNAGELFPETFDPQGNYDADSWNNMEEAAAGTDPYDANPPDGIIRPVTEHVPAVIGEQNGVPYVVSPEAIKVIWPSLAGKQYALKFSPDLTQGSWLPVGDPFIASGGVTTYTLDINGNDKRFWRVAVNDVDTDGDGLTDYEEDLSGSNPATADTDGDGLTDAEEAVIGTNPNTPHSDDDTLTDYEDAVPLDGEINWPKTPESKYVWIGQVTQTGARAVSRHGHILFPKSNDLLSGSNLSNVLWDSATSNYVTLTGASSWSGSGFLANTAPFDAEWNYIDDMNDEGMVVGRSKWIGITTPGPPPVVAYAVMKWKMSGTATEQYAAPIYIVPGFNHLPPYGDLEEILADDVGNVPRVADDGTISALSWLLSQANITFDTQWVASDAQVAAHSNDMALWSNLGTQDQNIQYRSGAVIGASGGLLVEHRPNIPKTVLHYRNGTAAESLEGLLPSTTYGITNTDIGRTPATSESTTGRIWFSVNHTGGDVAFLEKRDGGSGVSRWHNPYSMGNGAIHLNAQGEAITGGKPATQTVAAIPPKLWSNGKYTDLNDEKLTSKPSSVTITNAIDLASNGVILVQATENGVDKTGLYAPFGIDGHKRGTINAPGAKVAKGTGEYGQETVMMENADSDDNLTKPDYETAAVDATDDDDLVKVVLRWPKDLKAKGVKLELKHTGMEVDPTKTSDADKYKETGPSHLNFYKPDGTKLTDAQLKIDDLGNPGTGYLAEILTTGKLTLFIEGAEKFGLVGNDPKSATAAKKLGGAMLNFEVTQNGIINRARLLVYRGGFLVYRMPKVSPPLPSKGVLGTLEFWDGKGRVKHVFGGKGKEFKGDETDWGARLYNWSARSGRKDGKSYDLNDGEGHTPPGWWIQYKSTKKFSINQKNKWLTDDNNVSYLKQGGYCRWKADDETDPEKRFTFDYKYYPSLTKDAEIGDPSPTTIMFKFDMEPIPPSTAQNRLGIQIHPDGQCNDPVLGGTAGCIGIQTYQSCENVYRLLTRYTGLKVKVIQE